MRLTTNLENRKKLDFNLIVNAVKKKPKTFTELLHITRLQRKTLSLRLKELCTGSVIVKKTELYELNGISDFADKTIYSTKRFSKIRSNERVKAGFILVVLLFSLWSSGYVLAKFLAPSLNTEVKQEPIIIGTFTVDVYVANVTDLYGWQVAIVYDPDQLKVVDVIPGGFVGEEFPFFVTSTDTREDLLLLGGSLMGNVSGKSGSGKLATIMFGYYIDGYEKPRIALNEGSFYETILLDSNCNPLEIHNGTLTLIYNQQVHSGLN